MPFYMEAALYTTPCQGGQLRGLQFTGGSCWLAGVITTVVIM